MFSDDRFVGKLRLLAEKWTSPRTLQTSWGEFHEIDAKLGICYIRPLRSKYYRQVATTTVIPGNDKNKRRTSA